MKICHVLIKVDNQDKALAFYTTKLGFEKRNDIPVGPRRWLTVASPEGVHGVELVLELNDFPPASVSQRALYESGFPATVLTTTNIDADYKRLSALGVQFRGEPKNVGPVSVAQFEDTCGNLINLVQPAA